MPEPGVQSSRLSRAVTKPSKMRSMLKSSENTFWRPAAIVGECCRRTSWQNPKRSSKRSFCRVNATRSKSGLASCTSLTSSKSARHWLSASWAPLLRASRILLERADFSSLTTRLEPSNFDSGSPVWENEHSEASKKKMVLKTPSEIFAGIPEIRGYLSMPTDLDCGRIH